MTTMGEIIRETRRLRGITQRQLGNAVGYSALPILMIEWNRRVPSVELAQGIADTLDVQLGPLWRARRTEA